MSIIKVSADVLINNKIHILYVKSNNSKYYFYQNLQTFKCAMFYYGKAWSEIQTKPN